MVEKFERRLDVLQELTQSAAHHVGEIAKIITHCVSDVSKEIGSFVGDGFELREASQRAAADAGRLQARDGARDGLLDDFDGEIIDADDPRD